MYPELSSEQVRHVAGAIVAWDLGEKT